MKRLLLICLVIYSLSLGTKALAFDSGIHPRGLPPAASPTAAPTPAPLPKPARLPPPTPKNFPQTDKIIVVSLADQNLEYFQGTSLIGQFKISSGVKALPTPTGEFNVLAKKPLVAYKGPGYYFPNTKWNLMFKQQKGGNLYIHGAYWHHNFGHPMSHGCVNVSYSDMEPLYNWADVGTKVSIN